MKKLVFLILFFLIFPASSIISAQASYDFTDVKSSTLTKKAWASLVVKDWYGVNAYTEKCINLYTKTALKQQASLSTLPKQKEAFNFWALNDVGTSYYIKAKALTEQGKTEQAKKICNKVIEEYSYAQCWDKKGWFWVIKDACKDLISSMTKNIDFEDYTSETLTRKAWSSLRALNPDNAIIYAEKCISLYTKDAEKQQASLLDYPPAEYAFNYWALNDVGTCFFILGEAYSQAEEWYSAAESYRIVLEKYSFSQCWDPKSGFWKPARACQEKLDNIKSEQGLA